jgi:hypothetical protein
MLIGIGAFAGFAYPYFAFGNGPSINVNDFSPNMPQCMIQETGEDFTPRYSGNIIGVHHDFLL